jgi:hypothetical protein
MNYGVFLFYGPGQMLSKEAIEEFQSIYARTYGEKLSLAEATERATRLISFYKVVFGGPLTSQPKDLRDE